MSAIFLLKDEEGRALVMTEAASRAAADAYGFAHLPGYCGRSVEIDPDSRVEAEAYWGVATICLSSSSTTRATELDKPILTQLWVIGPELPPEVEAEGLLTPEDHRDLTLDHIARSCDFVWQVEIRKRA